MSEGHQTNGGSALAKGVKLLYQDGLVDYYLEPIVLVDAQGRPIGRIEDGDTVIFCCRRGEREIQLTEAFTEIKFDHFPRPNFQNLRFVILTLYHEKFKDLPVAFGPIVLQDTLGEIVSRAKLRQLRVAESEKFAHITFFFNGGNNQPFASQDDICIPSPKGIPFDQEPELSLPQVTSNVLGGIEQRYDLIVTNFANGDVIGHTQNPQTKIRCAEIVDKHLGQLVNAALSADYIIMVTADHGNLEVMVNPDGTPNGSHTDNFVPFLLVDPFLKSSIILRDGQLADIAPTILNALGISQPVAMNGISLAPARCWDSPRRVLLIILDGWGIGKQNDTNPIFLARTPVWDDLTRRYPHSRLQAAGDAVGLKMGKAGNSEAGHMNIGAGRVVLQDDSRLDMAVKDRSFFSNPVFCKALEDVNLQGSNLHLIGLLSKKSSHGSIDYPLAILKMAKDIGLEEVYLHLILDGRSTEPRSAPEMLEKLDRQVAKIGVGQIVSGVGRGIALDRDGNYAKTQRAYDAFVSGIGKKVRLE